jgi:hypothetical protein
MKFISELERDALQEFVTRTRAGEVLPFNMSTAGLPQGDCGCIAHHVWQFVQRTRGDAAWGTHPLGRSPHAYVMRPGHDELLARLYFNLSPQGTEGDFDCVTQQMAADAAERVLRDEEPWPTVNVRTGAYTVTLEG